MYENVSMVGARASTEDNTDEVLVSRSYLERLEREREEYRAVCLDFAKEVPKFHKIADNIETILNAGGVSE